MQKSDIACWFQLGGLLIRAVVAYWGGGRTTTYYGDT